MLAQGFKGDFDDSGCVPVSAGLGNDEEAEIASLHALASSDLCYKLLVVSTVKPEDFDDLSMLVIHCVDFCDLVFYLKNIYLLLAHHPDLVDR